MGNVLSFLLQVKWGTTPLEGSRHVLLSADSTPSSILQQPMHLLQALPSAFSSCSLCYWGIWITLQASLHCQLHSAS